MISSLTAILVISSVVAANAKYPENDRPIIGVMTQENKFPFEPEAKSSMSASYVKFVESGGARVVPIWIRKPVSYYKDIMSKINGILFPGGPDILESDGYGRTGRIIFEIATKMNEEGDFFPLWGTCLGMELLNFVVAEKSWMKSCTAMDLASNIEFVEGYKNSRIFRSLEKNLDHNMQNKDVTIHYHRWCLTPQNYSLSELDKYFKVLAVNRDSQNMTFVSIVEAFNYPFYGVMFHPEKVMFEWSLTKDYLNSPHNIDAIRTSQYFANFFVNEARKSNHHFPSKKEEDAVLIYNYNPAFLGIYNSSAVQNYFFYV